MITHIGTVAIYVDSQEEAKKFWTEKMGFVVATEQPMGPNVTWLEIAPDKENKTRLVIYPKEMMQQQNSDLISTPSLVFISNNIEDYYNKIKENGVEVGEIQSLPFGKMVDFKDNEGNQYMIKG